MLTTPASMSESTTPEREEDRGRNTPLPRRPPPMRVITKGWWTLEEKEVDIVEIEREDRLER